MVYLNVFPVFPFDDEMDRTEVNAELSCNFRLAEAFGMQFPYFDNLGVVQQCHPVAFSVAMTFCTDAIPNIVFGAAITDMRRRNTNRSIAVMQNMFMWLKRLIEALKNYTGHAILLSFVCRDSVTARGSASVPIQARIRIPWTRSVQNKSIQQLSDVVKIAGHIFGCPNSFMLGDCTKTAAFFASFTKGNIFEKMFGKNPLSSANTHALPKSNEKFGDVAKPLNRNISKGPSSVIFKLSFRSSRIRLHLCPLPRGILLRPTLLLQRGLSHYTAVLT